MRNVISISTTERKMIFDDYIKAHNDWKMKIRMYVNHPDNSIDTGTLSVDNACGLGKWIHGDGKKFMHLPEMKELVEEHKNFHKAAAEIVIKRNKGEDVSSFIDGNESIYRQSAAKLSTLLTKLKTLVK